MPYRARLLEDRFWEKVDKTGECWIWTAARQKFGYGKIAVRKGVFDLAHRVAYRISVGEIPEGKQVLHRCDVPGCVRPDHLFLGTQSDNMFDMHGKKRWTYKPRNQSGERNPNAILSDVQVAEALERIANGEGPVSVARHFGIAYKTLWAIRRRKTASN